jgi:hypothetical protein
MQTQIEQQIKIRQVTQIQASWTEKERGESGALTFQLILDNGVEEYVIRPTSSDADVLLKLFQQSNHVTFDAERKVLMFNTLPIK